MARLDQVVTTAALKLDGPQFELGSPQKFEVFPSLASEKYDAQTKGTVGSVASPRDCTRSRIRLLVKAVRTRRLTQPCHDSAFRS